MGYNKKVLSKATSELGKAKAPPKPRDIIMDPRGQWAYPGQPTRIPGNNITMQGVSYPVYGIDNTGFAQMMYPGQDYQFQGDYVDEYPLTQAKKGGQKKYSRSLTATNKLFTKNELFKKKKKKKKIFDPNARYYQDGGESVCLDNGRCFETDEEQRLLDLEADLRRKAVDTAGAAFELTGDAGDARKAFKKLGMKKSLGERLPGVENPYTCMYYAGMPYCINEGIDPKYFESNDKFIKAQAQGKIPFTQIAETRDPNFEQNLNIPTGSIVSLEKPTGMKHAMLSFKHPETGESSYFQSTGEESDWDIRNQVFYRPSENHPARIYQYTPFVAEREKLAEQARTNPTYYNTKLQTRPAQPLELELTEQEIKELQKGGWVVEDISVPTLNRAQKGMQTSCPDGLVWDDKLQECVKPGIQEYESVDVSANKEKNKEYIRLVDRLRQAKGAYQDWREDAGLRRTRLRNEGATSIEGLKREIAEYKKQLDEEKKAYSKAQSALKVLQNKWPEDDWFNAKLSDVLTPKGIEDLRALYAKGDISKETFMDFYESFGKDYDVNVIEGRGPNRAYSAKEAEQNWMENVPEFTQNVNDLVKGLLGVAGGGASLSLMGGAGNAARLASRVLGNKLVQGAVAADSIYTLGTESLPKLDRALESGENIGDAVFDVGLDAIDLIFAKGVIGDVAKFVNKGLVRADKYVAPIRNVLTTPIREMPYLEKALGLQNNLFLPQNKSAFKEALENLTPGQLMTGSAIAATTLGLPEYAQEAEQTYERLVDPNIAWRDKYSNLKSFGNRTGQLLLDYTPLSQRLKPLGETRASILYQMPEDFSKWEQGNWGSGYSAVNNILKLIEPRMGNLPNRQKGGSSNSYVTSLSKKEIKELERQGYKIEYLD